MQPTVCPFSDCPCGEGCACGAGCECGGQQRTIKQWVTLVKARESSNLPPLKGNVSVVELEGPLFGGREEAPMQDKGYSSVSVVGGGTSRMIYVSVGGMSCSSCVSHVEEAILTVAGVKRASVALLMERAEVWYDEVG